MKAKHFACVFIALLILLQLYGVLVIHGKVEVMKREADAASAAAEAARDQVNINTIALNGQKVKTDPIRKYLHVWEPYLRQSVNEERGQTMVDELIRQSGLQAIDRKYNSAPIAANAFVPKVIRAELLFEDDYHKSVEWLGELERAYPACRIFKCRLTKGSNANDIKMEITVDLPIVDDTMGAAKS
ncbi:MAG: hypothetical protein ACR2OZ_07365 [Verrucomicrobiales bacterium]